MKGLPPHSAGKALRGFTIMELLVAIALSTLLLVLLFSVMQNIMDNLGRVSDGVLRNDDASSALEQLSLDLEGLIHPQGTEHEVLRITSETVAGAESLWITFLTAATDRDNSDGANNTNIQGVPRAVSYRLAFQNPIDSSTTRPVFAIYRSIASAKHTFDYAMGSTNLQQDYWNSLSGAAPPPGPTTMEAFFAGNVAGIKMRVRCRELGDSKDHEWKPVSSLQVTGTQAFLNGDTTTPVEISQVEIELTALSSKGSVLLEDDPSNSTLKQQYSKRFTREVSFW